MQNHRTSKTQTLTLLERLYYQMVQMKLKSNKYCSGVIALSALISKLNAFTSMFE